MPDLLIDRERLAAEMAELNATLKASEARNDDQDDDTEDDGASDELLTGAQFKALKAERTKAKKNLKTLDANLLKSAAAAREEIVAEEFVLDLLRARLRDGLALRVATHRKGLVARYQTWHDKYAITLRHLEAQRDAAASKLNGVLGDLGYG